MSKPIVFTCPSCNGFICFNDAKCQWCGAPFHWTDKAIDIPKMKDVAEKVWRNPLLGVDVDKILPTAPPRTKRCGWEDRLKLLITFDGSNHYAIDRVTFEKVDYRVTGRMYVNALNDTTLVMLDWLMMNDEYFSIEMVSGGGLSTKYKNCKINGSDFMYTVHGGERVMSFSATTGA